MSNKANSHEGTSQAVHKARKAATPQQSQQSQLSQQLSQSSQQSYYSSSPLIQPLTQQDPINKEQLSLVHESNLLERLSESMIDNDKIPNCEISIEEELNNQIFEIDIIPAYQQLFVQFIKHLGDKDSQ